MTAVVLWAVTQGGGVIGERHCSALCRASSAHMVCSGNWRSALRGVCDQFPATAHPLLHSLQRIVTVFTASLCNWNTACVQRAIASSGRCRCAIDRRRVTADCQTGSLQPPARCCLASDDRRSRSTRWQRATDNNELACEVPMLNCLSASGRFSCTVWRPLGGRAITRHLCRCICGSRSKSPASSARGFSAVFAPLE
jgi:hypothetical protein